MIFKHVPTPSEVVLNLENLYCHEGFWPSVDHWTSQGVDFSSGIRNFRGSQHEVILTVDAVPHNEIYAFGGDATLQFQGDGVGGLPKIGEADPDPTVVEQNFSQFGLAPRRWVIPGFTQTCLGARTNPYELLKSTGRRFVNLGTQSTVVVLPASWMSAISCLTAVYRMPAIGWWVQLLRSRTPLLGSLV